MCISTMFSLSSVIFLSLNEHEADCSRSSTWLTTLQAESQTCSHFFVIEAALSCTYMTLRAKCSDV